MWGLSPHILLALADSRCNRTECQINERVSEKKTGHVKPFQEHRGCIPLLIEF